MAHGYPDFVSPAQLRDLTTITKDEGETNELSYTAIITCSGEGLIKGIKCWNESDVAAAQGSIKLEVDGGEIFTNITPGKTPIYIATRWGSSTTPAIDTLDIPFHTSFTIYGIGKRYGVTNYHIYAECIYNYL